MGTTQLIEAVDMLFTTIAAYIKNNIMHKLLKAGGYAGNKYVKNSNADYDANWGTVVTTGDSVSADIVYLAADVSLADTYTWYDTLMDFYLPAGSYLFFAVGTFYTSASAGIALRIISADTNTVIGGAEGTTIDGYNEASVVVQAPLITLTEAQTHVKVQALKTAATSSLIKSIGGNLGVSSYFSYIKVD